MNEIKRKIQNYYLHRKSLNACLVVLGADPKEVYFSNNITGKQKPLSKLNNPCEATSRSIYDTLQIEEMRGWVDYLYIESLKKYHPDKHPENVRFYTEICQELSKAYSQAKNILNRRKR